MSGQTVERDDADGCFRAWVAGDAEAGRALIRSQYHRVLRFFYDKVEPEAARDLTQETFETLCLRRNDYRGESSIRTFIYGIARWKLVHHFERKRVHEQCFVSSTDSGNTPAVETSITSLFAGRQREILIVRALRSLALDDQIILELRDFEGMTGKDIGAVFGVGRDTMSSRISRARKRLEAAIETLSASISLIPVTGSNLEDELKRIRAQIAAAAEV